MLEIDRFMDLARSRNTLIPELIVNNQIYMPGERLKTLMAMSVCRATVSGMDVEGVNHLEEAWQSVKDGKKLRVISNHHSDADHPIKRCIFRELGFYEFADRLVFLGGWKMVEREETQRFMPAESVVLVSTPGDISDIKEAYRLAHRKQLTEDQVDIVKKYAENCKEAGEVADAEIDRLMNSGKVLAFCPESTRTRDEKGRMGRAPKEIEKYFPKEEEEYVLPIMTDGTANIMNVEDEINVDRTRIRAVIGKLFPASEIWKVNLENVSMRGTPARPADVVMARLAVLMPELVFSEDLKVYQQICGDYNPREGKIKKYHSDSILDIFEGTPIERVSKRGINRAAGWVTNRTGIKLGFRQNRQQLGF